MPRYFFHRTDGTRDVDHEGTELPDLHRARIEAVLFAAGTLKDDPDELWQGGELRIEVSDETSMILFTVIMLAIDSPVVHASSQPTSAKIADGG